MRRGKFLKEASMYALPTQDMAKAATTVCKNDGSRQPLLQFSALSCKANVLLLETCLFHWASPFLGCPSVWQAESLATTKPPP